MKVVPMVQLLLNLPRCGRTATPLLRCCRCRETKKTLRFIGEWTHRCSSIPLSLREAIVQEACVAFYDITRDQTTMFMALICSQAEHRQLFYQILILMLIFSIYVRRSLQPLRQIDQLFGTISADDHQVRCGLQQAGSQRSQRIVKPST